MAARPGTVVTPEAVRLEFSLGGIATRSLAKFVDLLIVALGCGFSIYLGLIALAAADRSTTLPWGLEVWTRIFLALDIFVFAVFAMPLMEWLGRGRTPGKAMMGLRVVTDIGEGAGLRHAMVRGFVQVMEIPTGLGFFAALSNPRQQRLGDLAAGTIVIADSADRGHATMVPTIFPSPHGQEAFTAHIDVSAMTSEQFMLLRDFLLRCRLLTPEARHGLADEIATRVTGLVGPPPGPMVAELYLNCVASAYQQHHCPHLFGAVPVR